jgi:hypothetical protein
LPIIAGEAAKRVFASKQKPAPTPEEPKKEPETQPYSLSPVSSLGKYSKPSRFRSSSQRPPRVIKEGLGGVLKTASGLVKSGVASGLGKVAAVSAEASIRQQGQGEGTASSLLQGIGRMSAAGSAKLGGAMPQRTAGVKKVGSAISGFIDVARNLSQQYQKQNIVGTERGQIGVRGVGRQIIGNMIKDTVKGTANTLNTRASVLTAKNSPANTKAGRVEQEMGNKIISQGGGVARNNAIAQADALRASARGSSTPPITARSAPKNRSGGRQSVYVTRSNIPMMESKDEPRVVEHFIMRNKNVKEKVLYPIYNTLKKLKEKNKYNKDVGAKHLYYVVNYALRELNTGDKKVTLSQIEKARVVNDLLRNFEKSFR